MPQQDAKVIISDGVLQKVRNSISQIYNGDNGDNGVFDIYQIREFLNRCLPRKGEKVVNTIFSKTGLKNFFQEVSEDLHLCWREVLYLGLIALAFTLIIMVLLRYLVGVVVWTVLIGVCLACISGTAYLWVLWKQSETTMDSQNETKISDVDNRKNGSYLVFAIIASVVTVCILLVIFVIRKRIQLIIQLYKEAGKAVSVMPVLLIEPLLTFVSLGVVISIWIYFSMWTESSGFIEESRTKFIHYHKDFWMKFTRWYHLLGMFWMCQFVIGCQHMIIAGAVSIWYFTRNKDNLDSPIMHSAHNLVRYHLGSVALGSFAISIIQFIRATLQFIQSRMKNKWILKCCQCCLYCFEKFIKFLTRNAYIEIAMHGHSFCRAGRKAFKLLVANAVQVAAINSVGDFVLFLAKVLVVMATVLIGIEILKQKEGLQHMWVPVCLAALFAYFISHCFLTVYEMAIDTIFLCFCEDCQDNDGLGKPYYMSRGLMEFVENSKKVLKAYDKKAQAWQQESPQTISGRIS